MSPCISIFPATSTVPVFLTDTRNLNSVNRRQASTFRKSPRGPILEEVDSLRLPEYDRFLPTLDSQFWITGKATPHLLSGI